MKNIRTFVAVLVLASSACGANAADVLTGKNGMTLYTFDADSAGRSACGDTCLVVWPAARPGDATGADFGEFTRADGTQQLTYAGKPLYYFANDKKPGDRNGDNVRKVWHAAIPGAGAENKAVGAPGTYRSGYGTGGY